MVVPQALIKIANRLRPYRWLFLIGSQIGFIATFVFKVPKLSRIIVSNGLFYPVINTSGVILFWCSSFFILCLYANGEEKNKFIRSVSPSTNFQKVFLFVFAIFLFIIPVIQILMTPIVKR